jgi:hypothetical protein
VRQAFCYLAISFPGSNAFDLFANAYTGRYAIYRNDAFGAIV